MHKVNLHKKIIKLLQIDKDLEKLWKYTGKITKEFDSNTKGFLNHLQSSGTSKMQIPQSDRSSLGLVQSYLVFQVFLFSSKLFIIEIGISDTSKVNNKIKIKIKKNLDKKKINVFQ